MAINPSNSNTINIVNLPNAQLAVPGDYIILQTPNGTQKINFEDFNVVRTDILGNATVLGDLTGNNARFLDMRVANLTAANYHTVLGQGINGLNGVYDRFTIQDGLILSADNNPLNNPVYRAITNTYIPSITSQMASYIRDVQEYIIGPYRFDGITRGYSDSINIVLSGGLGEGFTGTPNPGMFSVMTSQPSLSTVPVVTNISRINNSVSYILDMGQPVPPGTVAYVKLQLIVPSVIQAATPTVIS